MPNSYSVLILGAGNQGVAAAFDAVLYGRVHRVVLADNSISNARNAAKKLHRLCSKVIAKNKIRLSTSIVHVEDCKNLRKMLIGHHAVLSALPYYYNPVVAEEAVRSKVNYCDLGGYFESTQKIHKLDRLAKSAGVTLIPDCGVSPGMCNLLAVCAMEKLSKTDGVNIYCGGLPQKPRPPLDYKVVFNLEGVLGNYFGKSYILRNGKIKLIPSFSEKEVIDFGRPFGKLEAFITGGATSTCPWSFKGMIKNYNYKTLRYPGHYDKIQCLKDLGLLETGPVQFNGAKIIPRKFFVAVAGPRLKFERDRDMLLMKVIARGVFGGEKVELSYSVAEKEDSKTGFSAMQRTTGFSAAIVLEILAANAVPLKGVVPLEKAVSGPFFLEQIRKRGIKIKESIRQVV